MRKKDNYNHTLYASYIGYIVQAIVNNFAPLLFLTFRDTYELSLDRITLLITVNFFVQLTVDLLSVKLVDKIGYRISVVAAHIFSAVGILSLGILPDILPDAYSGLLAAVVLYAVGGGLIEVLISPIVEACPTEKKSAAMSLLHSFYCWGQVFVVLASTVFFTLFGKSSWRLLACLWAAIPLANAVVFSRVPIYKLNDGAKGASLKELFSRKFFWLMVVMMVCAGASELSMSQWASAFAESGLGVSKTLGDLAGPCMFAAAMGTARVLYSKMSERINLSVFMLLCGLLCVTSYLFAAFSGSAALSLVACSICGLSVGIMWPGTFTLASSKIPKGGTAMFALLALAGDVGCTSGPTVVGMVSNAMGGDIKNGFAFAVVFPVLLIIGILLMMRNSRKKKAA